MVDLPPAAATAETPAGKKTDVPALGDVLIDRTRIAERVAELGRQVDSHYAGTVPVLVTVLRGAVTFAADLTRELSIVHELDFVALSPASGAGGGPAQILKDLQIPVAGRDVLLVEDVVDTGLTQRFLRSWLHTHEASSVEVCALLERPAQRIAGEAVRFSGFEAPAQFCVGYGLDYRQRYRSLPDIHELHLDPVTLDRLVGAGSPGPS